MHTPALLGQLSRTDAQQILSRIGEQLRRGTGPTPEQTFFLRQVRQGVEDLFITEIRERQARLPALQTGTHGYLAYQGGDLTPGCVSCVEYGLEAIRSVSSCNLSCRFCYYHGLEDEVEPLLPGQFALRGRACSVADLELMIDKVMRGPNPLQAIAWVWFEPFVDLPKHLRLVRYIHERGVHQHLYTNGTLCTPENLRLLGEAGLDEIRFNLAATLCAEPVLETMGVARHHFRYLCVESPMFPEYLESFLARREAILATGVDHVHCAELQVTAGSFEEYQLGDLYQYHDGYISPMWSRRLTCDLLERAAEEDWQDVVIHDCSNEVKFLRGISNTELGAVAYEPELELPLEWYQEALRRHELTSGAGD